MADRLVFPDRDAVKTPLNPAATLKELQTVRASMLDDGVSDNTLCQRWSDLRGKLYLANCFQVFARFGFPITSSELAVTDADSAALGSRIAELSAQRDDLNTLLDEDEQIIRNRLSRAIQLLYVSAFDKRLPDGRRSRMQSQAKQFIDVGDALERCRDDVVRMGFRFRSLMMMIDNINSVLAHPGLNDTYHATCREAADIAISVSNHLARVRYPFKHHEPGISVGKHLLPDTPDASSPLEVVDAVSTMLDRYATLLIRVAAGLTMLAETVESAAGFKRMPDHEEPDELGKIVDELEKEATRKRGIVERARGLLPWIQQIGMAFVIVALFVGIVWIAIMVVHPSTRPRATLAPLARATVPAPAPIPEPRSASTSDPEPVAITPPAEQTAPPPPARADADTPATRTPLSDHYNAQVDRALADLKTRDNEAVQVGALISLQNLPMLPERRDEVARLLDTFLDTDKPVLRRNIISAMETWGDQRTVSGLRSMLNRSDISVRERSAIQSTIDRITHPPDQPSVHLPAGSTSVPRTTPVPPSTTMPQNPNRLPTSMTIDSALQDLRSGKASSIQHGAMRLSVTPFDPARRDEVAAALIEAINQANGVNATFAIRALITWGNPTAAHVCVNLLRKSDIQKFDRYKLIEVIGAFGNGEDAKVLETFQSSAASFEVSRLKSAIDKITRRAAGE